jgi:transposase
LLTISCLEGEVILGVDTHRDTHAVVLIDALGRLVAAETFATTRRGITALISWAQGRGAIRRAGVEGTGSFGAGLTRRLRLEGIEVIEVTRAVRVGGRHRGKNDTRDAEAAARAVLSGQATAEPKRAMALSNRSACCATPARARSRRALKRSSNSRP